MSNKTCCFLLYELYILWDGISPDADIQAYESDWRRFRGVHGYDDCVELGIFWVSCFSTTHPLRFFS